MKKLLVLSCLLMTGYLALPQGLADRQLVKQVNQLLTQKYPAGEPGISLLIARKGQVIIEKAWGMANLELGVSLRPDHIFRIGSVTKEFTAAAILKLGEQRRLDLNDSLAKYVSTFSTKWPPITIHHLLTHTSGIPDYMSKKHPDPYIMRRDLSPVELIAHIQNESLLAAPGSRFNYSNSNYVLLGLIIEKVTGMSYHEYVSKNILEAAGLKETFFAREKQVVSNRVPGYWKLEKGFENAEYQTLSLGYACGDLLANVGDLYRWNTAVFKNKLLSAQSLEQALTTPRLMDGKNSGYGCGWMIDTIFGKLCYRHDGSVSGFGADTRYFPEDDVYMVFLVNVRSEESDARAREVITAISRMVLGVSSTREVKLEENILASYAGRYSANEKSAIIVTLENGKLFIEGSNPADNMSKMPIYPSSASTFFVKGFNVELEFIKDVNGNILQLVTVYNKKIRIEWNRDKE